MVQNDEVPKLDLEAPENGFPKWLLELDLSSADAIKPEKTVRCNYFKHLNKGSRGLPDKDCKYEVNSPWEMMQHIKKVHPWLNMSIKTATKYFEELYEHDHMVSEQGKKTPKYPSKEWVVKKAAVDVKNCEVIDDDSKSDDKLLGNRC